MPTIPEIKAELKTLGIKGTTGKNKAELMAMLESAKGSVPKRKRPQVAPEVPKRKRPLVASKVKEQLDAIKSLGQWVWRRFDANEAKGEDYKKGVMGGAKFTIKNVKQMFPGYWEDWASIIGKVINTPRINVIITKDGDIKVYGLLDINGDRPETKSQIDKAFVVECRDWMNDPSIPTVK